MYDTSFIVKYKTIEEELIDKLNKKSKFEEDQDVEEPYSKDDIYAICEELYRHELLTVFQVERFDDIKMQQTMQFVWEFLQLSSEFMIIFDVYCKKLFIEPKINSFIIMFNYDLFFLLHICICQYIENKQITEDIINMLLLKINNL